MAPPLSDPLNGDVVARKRNKNAPIKFLLPLIYAPLLPLIRISLRRQPILSECLLRSWTEPSCMGFTWFVWNFDKTYEHMKRLEALPGNGPWTSRKKRKNLNLL